jgi:UDPglucose 6-dehydrogenase/GDP-mannose 6-dehydrogenase
MRVSIIGAGHVGLVTGACLAEKGHSAICVDVDKKKVERIQRGGSPFSERGLEALVRKHMNGLLHATTDLSAAVAETDITFLAVGTPFNGREIDLTFVREAARNVGEALRNKSSYHVVVVKSTVIPGTTDKMVLPILEQASQKKAGADFGVGMNPEFLTEGEAIQDFMDPDRIVLGGIDERSISVMDALYAGFGNAERIKTNTRTAEMIKYASNLLLATLISFSNEMANFGAAVGGIDTVDVMRGVHSSKYLTLTRADGSRWVPPIASFLAAGCGFGGSCLPKDTQAMVSYGEQLDAPMPMLKAVLEVNHAQPQEILSRLKQEFSSLQGVRVAVLGLAFRPDTDDMRESPAIPILRELIAQGAQVQAYDPVANQEARKIFPNGELRLCDELPEALRNAQAVVLVTRWAEFQKVPQLLAALEPQPLVVDGRRMLAKDSVSRYAGIGL